MESEDEKNPKQHVSPQKCQPEAISQNWLKLAKILKITSFVPNFSAPNAVR